MEIRMKKQHLLRLAQWLEQLCEHRAFSQEEKNIVNWMEQFLPESHTLEEGKSLTLSLRKNTYDVWVGWCQELRTIREFDALDTEMDENIRFPTLSPYHGFVAYSWGDMLIDNPDNFADYEPTEEARKLHAALCHWYETNKEQWFPLREGEVDILTTWYFLLLEDECLPEEDREFYDWLRPYLHTTTYEVSFTIDVEAMSQKEAVDHLINHWERYRSHLKTTIKEKDEEWK